jgi:hydrogenase/urease accessory protein HupE
MNKIYTKLTALAAPLLATPVLAHSEQSSVINGIVHFMTEPDHLAVSALVAAAAIFAVRKAKGKRS